MFRRLFVNNVCFALDVHVIMVEGYVQNSSAQFGKDSTIDWEVDLICD